MHYLIKDTVFEKMVKFLKEQKRIHKNNENKLRTSIEGVYYICRTGCQIRLLPSVYGHWRAAHKIKDLKHGLSEAFGRKCLNILKKIQTWNG